MIYLFAGEDADKKIKSYEKFLKELPKGTPVFQITKNDFDPSALESFYSGASLFAAKSALVLRDVLGEEEIQSLVLSKLALLGESENIFIFIDGKLKKATLDAFKKARAEINVFEAAKEKKEKFNNFLIANAFGAKDKFHTWLYFRQAIEAGTEVDALAGILFWKAKDMILKRSYGKFKESELKNFAARIARLLPEARRKGPEAESAFEQFLLEAF